MQTEISGLGEEAEPVEVAGVAQGDTAYKGGARGQPPWLQTLRAPQATALVSKGS